MDHTKRNLRTVTAAVVAALAIGVAGTASAEPGEHENRADSAAVLLAKVPLEQAVAAAEQSTGGRALSIEMQRGRNGELYKVKTAAGDNLATVYVSPSDGKVVRTEQRGPIARLLDHEDRNEIARIAAAPTTLGAAIATAQQQTGGKAVEAAVENENGTIGFEIEVAKDGAFTKVFVDPATGQATKQAAAEDNEDHED